ncbi:UNVERIFIED_CONTAM: hypothetical protein GTU68_035807 [Idotea baltica]|nr:hypothetical protein [Idotea baltica]
MTHSILIVEDDHELRTLLARQLTKRGFEVVESDNGRIGLQQALSRDFSLLLLDIDLPEIDGLSICSAVRKSKPKQAIIMLTAKADEIEVVEGLEVGADDYLTKPLRLAEVFARIDALLRRTVIDETVITINFGPFMVNAERREAFIRDEPLNLTKLEFDLLLLLISSPGKVYSREQLLTLIWQTSVDGYEKAINATILRLRRKIEKEAAQPEYLLTVRGVGYCFCKKDDLPKQ